MEVEVGKDTTRASHFSVSSGMQARSQDLQTSAWPLKFLNFSPRSSKIAILKPTEALLKRKLDVSPHAQHLPSLVAFFDNAGVSLSGGSSTGGSAAGPAREAATCGWMC